MIPNESELDTFTKGEDKTESKTAEIPKEKGARAFFKYKNRLSSEKSTVKLRYEFLKEFGIVHNLISEDVAFCKNLEKNGHPIHIITDLRVGHEKKLLI